MPQTYKYKQIVVNADGPYDDVLTFQIVFSDKEEAFYQRRLNSPPNKGWFFLDGADWYPIRKELVPKQVVEARVQYGSGDIEEHIRKSHK